MIVVDRNDWTMVGTMVPTGTYRGTMVPVVPWYVVIIGIIIPIDV